VRKKKEKYGGRKMVWMPTGFVADSVSKPGKSPVFGNPKEFGMEYEEVTFKASDGVTLSGWLVKGGTDKVIIQSHFGIQCSRSGYTPQGKGMIKAYKKDIEFLKHVKHLINAGYTVLMYDFRNHGNSGKGKVPWVTGGVEEYKDVIAAVIYIKSRSEYKDANIGLLSICMGAVSTTYGNGIKGGLQEFPEIKALLAIQPLGLSDFLKGFGFSQNKIQAANKVNMERGGADFNADCLSHVKDITIPTMLVQVEKDPWYNRKWIEKYFDELKVEKEMFWIKEGFEHRFDAYAYFGHSPEKMLMFFEKYV
jgi:hypothetical protein